MTLGPRETRAVAFRDCDAGSRRARPRAHRGTDALGKTGLATAFARGVSMTLAYRARGRRRRHEAVADGT